MRGFGTAVIEEVDSRISFRKSSRASLATPADESPTRSTASSNRSFNSLSSSLYYNGRDNGKECKWLEIRIYKKKLITIEEGEEEE